MTKKRDFVAPTSRTMLHRIYFIDRRIAQGDYPSTTTLAKEYETSTATISRDIDFLRNMMGAPIEYSALNRGYYYTDKTYRLPAGFSTEQEMMALGMAKNLLNIYRDTPLFATVNTLLETMTSPFSQKSTTNKEVRWYENRVIFPQTATAKIDSQIWEIIVTAVKENKVITFDYQSAADEDYKPRKVRPYQLLFDSGEWFLFGYATARNAVRMYALPRIKNITLTNETFILPRDYDYTQYADGSYFGVFAGKKKTRYRIEFFDESKLWVKERVWAKDQTLEETKDSVIITFTSAQHDKVFEWLMSRYYTARPLEPKELVDIWKVSIKEMKKIADKT